MFVCVYIYSIYLEGGSRSNKGREGGWGVSECKRKNIEVKSKEAETKTFSFLLRKTPSLIYKTYLLESKRVALDFILSDRQAKADVVYQQIQLRPRAKLPNLDGLLI